MVYNKMDFMQNKNWYYYDSEEYNVYRLTPEAPEEVYEDYQNYLKTLINFGEISKPIYNIIMKEIESNKASQLYGINIAK
jgi:hypothetical protein